jgi:tRNA G18 (ribose-2'-O)-methylase SpoU
MSTIRSASLRLFARHFSNAGYRKPFNNNRAKSYSPSTSSSTSQWDHVYGLSSVLSALHSKKRFVLDTVYIQESDEKKTTQKKDSSLLDEILQLTKESKIHTIAVDKGRLNNLTDNKTHQVSEAIA